MLLFIDDSRTIKIARQADNGPREVLGKVKKHDLVLPEDVLEHLSPEEIEEVEGVFDVINDGETHRIKAAVAQFPTTVREVLTTIVRAPARLSSAGSWVHCWKACAWCVVTIARSSPEGAAIVTV